MFYVGGSTLPVSADLVFCVGGSTLPVSVDVVFCNSVRRRRRLCPASCNISSTQFCIFGVNEGNNTTMVVHGTLYSHIFPVSFFAPYDVTKCKIKCQWVQEDYISWLQTSLV